MFGMTCTADRRKETRRNVPKHRRSYGRQFFLAARNNMRFHISSDPQCKTFLHERFGCLFHLKDLGVWRTKMHVFVFLFTLPFAPFLVVCKCVCVCWLFVVYRFQFLVVVVVVVVVVAVVVVVVMIHKQPLYHPRSKMMKQGISRYVLRMYGPKIWSIFSGDL